MVRRQRHHVDGEPDPDGHHPLQRHRGQPVVLDPHRHLRVRLDGVRHFRVQVVVGGVTTTLRTFTNVGTSSTYTQLSHSLLAYKGTSVTVKFLMNEDSSLQTSFVVDDTAVTVS